MKPLDRILRFLSFNLFRFCRTKMIRLENENLFTVNYSCKNEVITCHEEKNLSLEGESKHSKRKLGKGCFSFKIITMRWSLCYVVHSRLNQITLPKKQVLILKQSNLFVLACNRDCMHFSVQSKSDICFTIMFSLAYQRVRCIDWDLGLLRMSVRFFSGNWLPPPVWNRTMDIHVWNLSTCYPCMMHMDIHVWNRSSCIFLAWCTWI